MIQNQSICICIPARFASTRLPGKPLALIDGKPMVIKVLEHMTKSKYADHVVVLTDHENVLNTVRDNGYNAVMTDVNHPSGTARLIEHAEDSNFDFYINTQGDEPLISNENIDYFIEQMVIHQAPITTPYNEIKKSENLFDFNHVKCVFTKDGRALYFSRQAIPAFRDLPYRDWFKNHTYYKHIGIYAFTKETLLKLKETQKSELEVAEALEQLNWLENGFSIQGIEMEINNISVDTPEDLVKINEILKNK